MAPHGMARLGKAWSGMAWRGKAGDAISRLVNYGGRSSGLPDYAYLDYLVPDNPGDADVLEHLASNSLGCGFWTTTVTVPPEAEPSRITEASRDAALAALNGVASALYLTQDDLVTSY